jgi:hypothetical protein
MIENTDVSVHPAMNIALDGDHDLGFYELAIERRIARSLAMIPLAIQVGHGMNVVGYGIGIDYLEGLIGLETNDARVKPAAALIDDNRCWWRRKVLTFKSLSYVDERIREPVTVGDDERLVE